MHRLDRNGLRAGAAQWSPESRSVPASLHGPSAVRSEALAELEALLLRGARFELRRSRQALPRLSDAELDALATRAADDALLAVVARLDSFRGASRFTTWAAKFALREARLQAGAARRGAAAPVPGGVATLPERQSRS